MKLVIDNRTGYLNDYYFQTLCLLYFPGEKFKEGFEKVKAIYAAAGALDNCKLVIGDEGHRFYAAQSWPLFDELI